MLIFENDIYRLSLIHEKFYLVEILGDVEFQIKHLEDIVEKQRFYGLGPMPTVIDPNDTVFTSTELLSHLAEKENSPFSKADAFIINSISHRILAKLYQRIRPLERPTGFFKTREEAITWLEGYL